MVKAKICHYLWDKNFMYFSLRTQTYFWLSHLQATCTYD